jgi:hypothetical protein
MFITEVGFANVRKSGHFLTVHFDLAQSVERNLLIGKLFGHGLDTTTVRGTARTVTFAMLRSILTTRAETRREEQAPSATLDKSPAVSLVFRPAPREAPERDRGWAPIAA